jgi:ATP-dependent DNA helicase RecG
MPSHFDLNEIAERESERVEWKENVANVENVVATLSDFANDFANLGGGYVICVAKEGKDQYAGRRLPTAAF